MPVLVGFGSESFRFKDASYTFIKLLCVTYLALSRHTSALVKSLALGLRPRPINFVNSFLSILMRALARVGGDELIVFRFGLYDAFKLNFRHFDGNLWWL